MNIDAQNLDFININIDIYVEKYMVNCFFWRTSIYHWRKHKNIQFLWQLLLNSDSSKTSCCGFIVLSSSQVLHTVTCKNLQPLKKAISVKSDKTRDIYVT